MKTKTTFVYEVNDTMIVADTITKAIEIHQSKFPYEDVTEVRKKNCKGYYEALMASGYETETIQG